MTVITHARILSILLAGIFVLTTTANGGELIQGAFGKTLGEKVDPSTATIKTVGSDGLEISFQPETLSPVFSEFTALLTPLTYWIYGIQARDPRRDLNDCQTVARTLFAAVSKKYEGDEFGTKLLELHNRRGYILNQEQPGRAIRLKCDERGDLSALYFDEALNKAAELEQAEWNRVASAYDAGNYAESLPRLREWATGGHFQSAFYLGLSYRQGKGVPQDLPTAENYYLQAAKQGFVNAQYNLGTVYLTQSRWKEAETWLRRAAEKEDVKAQFNLAQLYSHHSELFNEEEAFRWYLKSAEGGHTEAQYKTCHMYSAGEGMQRDEVYAYKWCDIAAAQGHLVAQKNRDSIAKRMDKQQVKRAEEMAQRWLAYKREK